MPLQNRVDPFGAVHAVAMRGMFTGNRGVIHDPATRTLLIRRWTTRAWIVCTLAHPRGDRREVMGRNAATGGPGWTELFFLDEVTALAAGHRPCFYCRRAQASDFAARFGHALGITSPRAGDIDGHLHGERLAAGAVRSEFAAEAVADLPEGAMVSIDGMPHALWENRLLPWTFSGYGAPRSMDGLQGQAIALITPPTTCAVLKQGYRPVWHPGAGS